MRVCAKFVCVYTCMGVSVHEAIGVCADTLPQRGGGGGGGGVGGRRRRRREEEEKAEEDKSIPRLNLGSCVHQPCSAPALSAPTPGFRQQSALQSPVLYPPTHLPPHLPWACRLHLKKPYLSGWACRRCSFASHQERKRGVYPERERAESSVHSLARSRRLVSAPTAQYEHGSCEGHSGQHVHLARSESHDCLLR